MVQSLTLGAHAHEGYSTCFVCLSAVCWLHITVIHGFEHKSRLFAKILNSLIPLPRLLSKVTAFHPSFPDMAAILLNSNYMSSVYYTGNLWRTRTMEKTVLNNAHRFWGYWQHSELHSGFYVQEMYTFQWSIADKRNKQKALLSIRLKELPMKRQARRLSLGIFYAIKPPNSYEHHWQLQFTVQNHGWF